MSLLYTCCVCSSKFEDVGHFEISHSKRTGILCKTEKGHPLCNLCFARLYPQMCPICKEDISGNKFGFPDELTESLKTREEVSRLCIKQNFLLLAGYLFFPAAFSEGQLYRHYGKRRKNDRKPKASRGDSARIE